MALPTGLQSYVRSGGNDTNGGGFNPARGGANYANQDSPVVAGSQGNAENGNAVFTDFSVTFPVDVAGNLLFVISGTGTLAAAVYEIVSRTDANTIVLDRTCAGDATATDIVYRVGGAYGSPAVAATRSPAGTVNSRCVIHIKTASYTISSTTIGASNGRVELKSYTTMIGFGVTPEDDGERPVLQASGISSTTIISPNSADSMYVRNMTVDGANLASITGFGSGNFAGIYERCRAYRCTTGFSVSSSARWTTFRCRADACTTGFVGIGISFCEAVGCGTGFGPSTSQMATIYCVARNCTTAGFANHEGTQIHCVAYNCAQPFGFDKTGLKVNCIAFTPGGTSAAIASGAFGLNVNNATENDTAPTTSIRRNHILLTGDPFEDGANGDLRLNAYGRLVLGGTGYQWLESLGDMTGADVGAVQSPPSGGYPRSRLLGGAA